MTKIKSRALSGTPPEAAHLKGSELQEWAALGFLRNLDNVAQQNDWEQVLPGICANTVCSQKATMSPYQLAFIV